MRNTIAYSLFVVVIFLSGLFIGVKVGTAMGAGSNSTELYNSVIHLSAVYQQIENDDLIDAKLSICDFVKTRVELLALGHQMLNRDRAKEILDLKDGLDALYASIPLSDTSLTKQCF